MPKYWGGTVLWVGTISAKKKVSFQSKFPPGISINILEIEKSCFGEFFWHLIRKNGKNKRPTGKKSGKILK